MKAPSVPRTARKAPSAPAGGAACKGAKNAPCERARAGKAGASGNRALTPAERKLSTQLARAVERLRGLEGEVKAFKRAVPKLVKATTRADRARATRVAKEQAKKERAAAAAEKRARALADQLAKRQARADAAAAKKAASAAAKLAAAEARRFARDAERAAKGHPIEGCGKPYAKFKPLDAELYGEVATAINAQRSREGKFGKASRQQVQAALGKLKRERFEEYERECAMELQKLVTGRREPASPVDPRDFQDVPF